MNLLADIETGLRATAETILGHAGTLAAEAQRIQASPIAQILESVVLTPAEEAMIARIIGELPALRGAQGASAAPEAPAQPDVPPEVPQPVFAGPDVGGAAA